MTVHCGFVRGKIPGPNTGFDIDEADLLEMQQCQRSVVASAIFGNYDIMQQPENISEFSKNTVCFFMFLDEGTEAAIKNSSTIDHTKRIGLWLMVVVRNLPYSDARRNGKVPKPLLHRLFPNVRYSIWIDGKLKLMRDHYQILESYVTDSCGGRMLALQFPDVTDVLMSSRKLKPTRLVEDVPEGCVIIREHITITNLFTCLWFNEVDCFT